MNFPILQLHNITQLLVNHLRVDSHHLEYAKCCEEQQLFTLCLDNWALMEAQMALFLLNNALNHLSGSAPVFVTISTGTAPLGRRRHLILDWSDVDIVVHVEI